MPLNRGTERGRNGRDRGSLDKATDTRDLFNVKLKTFGSSPRQTIFSDQYCLRPGVTPGSQSQQSNDLESDTDSEVHNLVYNLDGLGTSQEGIEDSEEQILFEQNDKGGESEEATEERIKESEEESRGRSRRIKRRSKKQQTP